MEVTQKNDSGETTVRVEYDYDVTDHMIGRREFFGNSTTPAKSEYFVWDGWNIALILDGAGAVVERRFNGDAADQVFASEDALNEVTWLLADHLNSPRDFIDSSGALLNHRVYDSFGLITSESNSTIGSNIAFTGGYRDTVTNLVYRWHRWYSPHTHRWMSEDWIEDDLKNSYRATRNDPIHRRDPSGFAPPGPNGIEGINPPGVEANNARSGPPDVLGKDQSTLDTFVFPVPPPPANATQPPAEPKRLDNEKNGVVRDVFTTPFRLYVSRDKADLLRNIYNFKCRETSPNFGEYKSEVAPIYFATEGSHFVMTFGKTPPGTLVGPSGLDTCIGVIIFDRQNGKAYVFHFSNTEDAASTLNKYAKEIDPSSRGYLAGGDNSKASNVQLSEILAELSRQRLRILGHSDTQQLFIDCNGNAYVFDARPQPNREIRRKP